MTCALTMTGPHPRPFITSVFAAIMTMVVGRGDLCSSLKLEKGWYSHLKEQTSVVAVAAIANSSQHLLGQILKPL